MSEMSLLFTQNSLLWFYIAVLSAIPRVLFCISFVFIHFTCIYIFYFIHFIYIRCVYCTYIIYLFINFVLLFIKQHIQNSQFTVEAKNPLQYIPCRKIWSSLPRKNNVILADKCWPICAVRCKHWISKGGIQHVISSYTRHKIYPETFLNTAAL